MGGSNGIEVVILIDLWGTSFAGDHFFLGTPSFLGSQISYHSHFLSLGTIIFNYFSHVSLHYTTSKSVFTRYSLSAQSHLLPSLSLASSSTSYKPPIYFTLAQSFFRSSRHNYIPLPTWHLPSDICHLTLNLYKMNWSFLPNLVHGSFLPNHYSSS